MNWRSVRLLVLGIVLGGLAGVLAMGGIATAWGWRAGAAARGNEIIVVRARPAQAQAPTLNPREFVPVPNTGNLPGTGQQPAAGTGGQNCDRILYFYQGRLYELRPGPMPPNGGNPEFFFMQPYNGPQIPGFPQPEPGTPGIPNMPGQPVPPTLKF
jgi:hypothetical protein